MYKVHLDKKDQFTAESQCNNADGNLAHFDNTQEYEYVVKELDKIGQSAGVVSFYIGEITMSPKTVHFSL